MLAALLLLAPAGATDIGTERTLGVGGVFGTATGASGRVYFGKARRVSLDFAFGVTNGQSVYDAVFGHVSAHWQSPLATHERVVVPWRVGLGGFVSNRDTLEAGATGFGLRVPVGIDLDLSRAPVQFSFEVSPVSLLVTPAVSYGLDASVAVRYYL